MASIGTWIGRHRRGLARAVTATAITLGLGVGGIAVAGPAAASSLFGTCDANETLPLVEDPGLSGDGIAFRVETIDGVKVATLGGQDSATVSDNLTPGKAIPEVLPQDLTSASPALQFGGSGLRWAAFANNCTSAIEGKTEGLFMGNTVLNVAVVWPVRILGLLLRFSFSTGLSDLLLAGAGDVVTQLSKGVFWAWAPLVTLLTCIFAAFRLVRGQARKASQSVLWALLVTTVMLGPLTTWGVQVVTSINDYVRSITTCITFSTMGVPCSDDTGATFSAGMVETLATGVWGGGALGTLADEQIPTTLHVKKSGDIPHFARDMDVHIPASAIPARTPGQPTWAETLRWTQTLTASDEAAIASDPTLACTLVGSGPTTNDITQATPPTGMGICGGKWLVRAGILSELRQHHPTAYALAVGDGDSLTAAMGGLGVLPLAIGIGVMGVMLFLYQIELVGLFLSTPVVALLSMLRINVARRWINNIGATLVRRLSVGLAVGITIWGTAAASGLLIKHASDFGIPPILMPFGVALATIVIMVGGWKLLGMWRDMLAVTVGVPEGESTLVENAKTGGKKALEMGIGAASGALAAGSGLRAAGAFRGMFAGGGGTVGRTVRTIDGMRTRAATEKGRVAADQDRAVAADERRTTDLVHVDRVLQDAPGKLAATPEGQDFVTAVKALSMAAVEAATKAVKDAEDRLKAFDASPAEQARMRDRTSALVGDGVPIEEAREQARAESSMREVMVRSVAQARSGLLTAQDELDAHLDAEVDQWAHRLGDAISAAAEADPRGWQSETSFADKVGAAHGINSREGLAAMRSIEDAMRTQARLAHTRFNLADQERG